MKLPVACIAVLTGLGAAWGQPTLTPRPAAAMLEQTQVGKWEAAAGRLRFDASGDARPGDRFWVIDEEQLLAAGVVSEVSDRQCIGRPSLLLKEPAAGARLVVVHYEGLKKLRESMPPQTTVRGRLSRLPPGRRTGWIDLGRRSGLAEGDTLMARRKGLPIARGQVSILQDDYALLALRPLVGNALPEPDDEVELWPAPAELRGGRVNTTVLDCRPANKTTMLTLSGAAQEGLAAGRGVDLIRGGGYVGAGAITEASDLLAVAQIIEAASTMPPQVGDEAVVRAAVGEVRPLRVAVFKVEADKYCLLAAGENDGVTVKEKFIVRRPTPGGAGMTDIAELTVRAVKIDYCDADVKLLDANTKLLAWDFAERVSPPWEHWLVTGGVRAVHAEARTLLADVDPKAAPQPGDMLRCTAEGNNATPPTAALVVHAWRDAALLYVPRGWGDLSNLNHARAEQKMQLQQPAE